MGPSHSVGANPIQSFPCLNSWLEEISRKQAEMVAARLSAEKLRVRDDTLTAENEKLKVFITFFVESVRAVSYIPSKPTVVVGLSMAACIPPLNWLLMMQTQSAGLQKRIGELEQEIKKLSGQQNLQQRIHHHAKIKVWRIPGAGVSTSSCLANYLRY